MHSENSAKNYQRCCKIAKSSKLLHKFDDDKKDGGIKFRTGSRNSANYGNLCMRYEKKAKKQDNVSRLIRYLSVLGNRQLNAGVRILTRN